ncbi:MAG: hypothetical protein HQK49_19590 [Oligoflexia bacterium]|nr:hypothetical protein [Oligoflexia bacterium]
MTRLQLGQKLIDLEKEYLGKVLTIAESSLSEPQFKAFKKLVTDEFYNGLIIGTKELLNKAEFLESYK